MSNKLLILSREQEKFAQQIKKLNLPQLEFFAPESEKEISKVLPICNILFGDPPLAYRYINQMPNLKWYHSTFTGVDALISESLRQDYVLTNTRTVFSRAMAEYVLGYILMFEKRIIEHIDAQKEKRWLQQPSATLENKTLAIMGTGSVGQLLAKFAKTCGLNVIGYKRTQEPVEYFDDIYTEPNLDKFLSCADFLVSILPTTAATKNIIDERAFELMKNSAVFINIGRGSTVNHFDLIKALRKNQIKAAVLDVFESEPLPKDNPLWDMPNVYITPHISGYVITDDIFNIFAENYKKFVVGDPLLYQVEFERGY